jgi:hypothetical protein
MTTTLQNATPDDLLAFLRSSDPIPRRAALPGQGTDYVNSHPIVIMYVAQLLWLGARATFDTDAYCKAYSVCEERAKQVA